MNDPRGHRWTPDDRSVLVSHGERLNNSDTTFQRLEGEIRALRAQIEAEQVRMLPLYQVHGWFTQTFSFLRLVGSIAALISAVYGAVKLFGLG